MPRGKKALMVSNLAVLQNGSEKANHEESSQQKTQAGLAKKSRQTISVLIGQVHQSVTGF